MDELRLIYDHRILEDVVHQRDIENDLDLVTGQNAEIADVDEPGAVNAAEGVGAGNVPARGNADDRKRTGLEGGKGIQAPEIVAEGECAERLVDAPKAQPVAQRVARQGGGDALAAERVMDGFLEEIAGKGSQHRMSVLAVGDPHCAVRQGAGVGLADAGIFAVEPLDGAGDIGEHCAVFGRFVELCPVFEEQMLTRPDGACRLVKHKGEFAGWRACRARIAERVIAPRRQRTRGSVGSEDAHASRELRRETAHRATQRGVRRLLRQPIDDGDVPGVPSPDVSHLDAEISPLAQVQRRAHR